ncbi:amidohydrolase family protein [Roseateles sp. UC29_93]|uniref:amidohydrolase family protein n=1 Tax=Roseateles sp. UC29_93 TaxID=3350177 RepID=UPI0036735289
MSPCAAAATPSAPPPPLVLHDAGPRPPLRLAGGLVVAPGSPGPAGPDIALRGDRLLPGLINAHEHLHRNSLPRLQYRARHRNIADWIADITPRRTTDPVLLADAARPREQRLWHGAIKNLLSGVTTVAHHDPLDPALCAADFPVRVLVHPAWRNALGLDGEEALRRSHRDTPSGVPWMVHAAEGIDAAAAAEFNTLERLGCITPNARLVHGVGLSAPQRDRLIARGAALIWCPGSNLHLFGRTAEVGVLLAHGRVALGSDSRASGRRDLLEELALARELQGLSESEAQALVTTRAAELLALPDRGHLAAGARADLLALPAGLPLSRAARADLRLVMVGGELLLADPDVAEAFGATAADLLPVRLDGRPKRLARRLVRRLRALGVEEPGLELTGSGLSGEAAA